MKYFYDLEFLEDGQTIDFISIGVHAEDGREYYAVSQDIQGETRYNKIVKNRWIMENVISQLPLARHSNGQPRIVLPTNTYPQNPRFVLDETDLCVLPEAVIAKQLQAFLYADPDPIELWAWYGAYDHVRLMWMWGSMMRRPERLPMWTHDINQHAEHKGLTPDELAAAIPQAQGLHNAMADARHLHAMWQYLEAKP